MAKKKNTITPEEPKLFEKFWDKYAMKLDRIAAVRAWNNLDKDLRRAAIDGIQHYCEICETLGVNRMWPQGYLNHRRWEDESPGPAPIPDVPSPTRSLSPVERGDAKGHDIPLQGGAMGADIPDMAIW
jgi:hypothetical protein